MTVTLVAGDVLLYRPTSLFGHLIRLKTWHDISHIEIFTGNGYSVASRDGIGTGLYPVRLDHLALICRPKPDAGFDIHAAMAWFHAQPHQKYGWWELLEFIGVPVEGQGVVCSAFGTMFSRGGGLDPFNGEDARLIAPFEFAIANCYTHVAPEGLHA